MPRFNLYRDRAASEIAKHLQASRHASAEAADLLTAEEIDDALAVARRANPCIALGAILYRARLRELGREEALKGAKRDGQVIDATPLELPEASDHPFSESRPSYAVPPGCELLAQDE